MADKHSKQFLHIITLQYCRGCPLPQTDIRDSGQPHCDWLSVALTRPTGVVAPVTGTTTSRPSLPRTLRPKRRVAPVLLSSCVGLLRVGGCAANGTDHARSGDAASDSAATATLTPTPVVACSGSRVQFPAVAAQVVDMQLAVHSHNAPQGSGDITSAAI